MRKRWSFHQLQVERCLVFLFWEGYTTDTSELRKINCWIVEVAPTSQFTSLAFSSQLEAASIKISMDGKGRALDNIWVERLWRAVKWEDFYLKVYSTVDEVLVGLGEYFDFYNHRRPHQSLGYRTPASVYFNN